MSDDHRTTPGAGGGGHISGVGFAPFADEAKKPAEFDRIRALLVRYAARLQDKNDEPPGQFLLAHAFLQAVEMLDLLALRASLMGVERAVPITDWAIVADEPVLIYVVHTNAEFEKDEKRRQEEWEGWTVGRWITHNNGGWMYYGMMGRVTHVAPLPAPPRRMIAEEQTGAK